MVGAGRTDAGVHAVGQVIHFDTGWRHSVQDLEGGLNALLPEDVAVRQLEEVPRGFHARHSATSRAYRYVILNQESRSPMRERYMYRVSAPLDVEAMRQSCAYLVGCRDYAAFGQATVGSSTVRTVHRAAWVLEDGQSRGLESSSCLALGQNGGSRWARFEVEASSYLRGMVRRLVGTMLWVGMGKLTPWDFREILDCAEIARAAPPAPARGLCLARVEY